MNISIRLLALILITGSSHAGATGSAELTCETLGSRASIVEGGGNYEMLVTIDNRTSRAFMAPSDALFTNNFQFSGVETETGKRVATRTSLVSAGISPIVIEPGKSVSRTVRLNDVFPNLTQSLLRSDVKITWRIAIRSAGDGCFTSETINAVVLKKQR